MFRSIINEEIKTISKKRKIIALLKVMKKKKMHINSMKLNSTKVMHLKEIVARVVFLRFIYIIAYSTISVMIENVKIKIMFNNKIKVNCIFKRLIDIVQLFVRQNINIIIISVIDERAHFFNVCETISINIKNIIISIFVFIVKYLNHELFLKRFFQRAARMSFINMNNKFFEMILHSLNEKKRINFLKMFVEHVNNKNKETMFAMKTLNDDLINVIILKFKSDRRKSLKTKIHAVRIVFSSSFKMKLTSRDLDFFINSDFLNIRLKYLRNDLLTIYPIKRIVI